MLVDGGLGLDLGKAAESARDGEAAGYDGLWTAETNHDPFLPLVLGAEATERVELGTGIAVAFARSPMTLANSAYDLQAFSGGRLLLGLGSQIKAHITKRFSMPWSHPAPRMREFILAMRAIWTAWETGDKLDFRGDFYQHTLMTPFFVPEPHPYGQPKVFLAAVGQLMTEVAGEVADGMLCHGFTTESYLREVTLPSIERGLAKRGRTLADGDFQLSLPAFVVTGTTEEEVAFPVARYGPIIDLRRTFRDRHGVLDLGPPLTGDGAVNAAAHRPPRAQVLLQFLRQHPAGLDEQ